ncbi:MAG TPA: Gfo/Idh/MocA family oxidoreductase [Acidimicrobiia bacterium]|nr:Gfo/Idh/MocA family oxidoreductase [Acidimicrobiia bacterium]
MTGVVVVGTGFGCFTHVRALRAAGFDVVAVVGRDPEKTTRRARAFDVPRALTSVPLALSLADVEAVSIATPPLTHGVIVGAALDAGKHVLCEKPFARDAPEARSLRAQAERSGVVHLLGTEFRFDTGQALLARAVRDGCVGQPRLAMLLLHVPVLADADAELPDWWRDADQGGGWLGAHGSQVIDQVRVTLGEFTSVSASLLHVADRAVADTGVTADDGFVVHFRLDSGVAGVMQSTAADRGPMVIETRVIGTDGSAWIDGLGSTVRVSDADGPRKLAVPPDLVTAPPGSPPASTLETTYEQMIGHGLDLGAYTRLAEHFRARIKGVEPPPGPQPATFADGVADMAVLDAMRRSATEHRTVAVPAPAI